MVTLFGVIKDLEMRSSWIIRVGPKSDDKCPYKKSRPEKTQGGGHVRTEADTGQKMGPGLPGTPRAPRSWRRQEEPPLEAFVGSW